jgi:hypothetical protein
VPDGSGTGVEAGFAVVPPGPLAGQAGPAREAIPAGA